MSDGDARRISRREFVARAGVAAGAYGALAEPAVAAKRRHKHRRLKAHVAVLGGGVAGLTAAHELAERGFKVTVVEPKALGGKARSIPVPHTGSGGRANLPGEHGFRFFPGFYKNVPDTMQELNSGGQTVLFDDMIVSWFLDPAIHYPHGTRRPAANREPLLINTAGSLDDRPNSHTAIPNLFLASDYVRTNVDLATMEGANEAARQAVNKLLAQSGSRAAPATLGTLWQPRELDALRNTDAVRYKNGQPNVFDTPPGSPA